MFFRKFTYLHKKIAPKSDFFEFGLWPSGHSPLLKLYPEGVIGLTVTDDEELTIADDLLKAGC